MEGWISNNQNFNLIIINEDIIKYNDYVYYWQTNSNFPAKHQ